MHFVRLEAVWRAEQAPIGSQAEMTREEEKRQVVKKLLVQLMCSHGATSCGPAGIVGGLSPSGFQLHLRK